jgi:hypothetical protein
MSDTKLCQSCIERGIKPANPATREWQEGIFYCEECFQAVLENLINLSPAAVQLYTESINGQEVTNGPILDRIYEIYEMPKELQFDKLDVVQRHHDKIFLFHAPATVNRTEESLAAELEQLSKSIFYLRYRAETIEGRISVLKEERRKEKGLKDYKDSTEKYAKVKVSKTKLSQEEKMATALKMSLEEYRKMVDGGKELEKKKREREFWIMSDNCPECGGEKPCKEHPDAK